MNAKHIGAIPFVLILLPYLIGIIAGINFFSFFSALSITAFVAVLIITAAAFILLNVFYKPLSIYKKPWTGGLLLGLALITAGVVNVRLYNQQANPSHFSRFKANNLVVKIIEEPLWKNETLRFTAAVIQTVSYHNTTQTTGRILVSIKDTLAIGLAYGDVLLIPAKYNEVDPPFNPAEFNYKQYLANKNIYHRAYLYPGQYATLKSGQGNPLIAYALTLRQKLVNKLHAHIHNPEAAAVAATLILGYKAQLSDAVLQAYSKTGTIHVLSVSGAHVGLVYVVLLFALSFLTRYRHGRIIQAALIILLVWFYAMLTGFSPPVCRAAVMLSLIVAGKAYSRHISTLNILAFAAFAMLLYNPLLATNVGFQLSYLAVAGLIILQPLIYKLISIKNKWADKIWMVCSASIAAQAATLPLSAYYFHQIPVYFLISNLFILIPSALIMYGGMLYLLIPQEFFLSNWLGYALEKLIVFTNDTLAFIEHMPLSVIGKIWLLPIGYLLMYAILFALCMFLYKRNKRYIYLTGVLVLIFNIWVGVKKYHADNSSDLVFLNVRNNTGMVFRNGKDAVVVTDLQQNSDVFKYAIQPYLDSSKVNHTQIIGLNENLETDFFEKNDKLIRFLDTNIFIADKEASQPVKADFYYLTGNTRLNLDSIKTINSRLTLVINGDNSIHYTNALINKAQLFNINFKILKRNKALTISSNTNN